ncbi:MAG TPA: hypothetical protein PKC69_03495 [Chitinophagaceae bacterium]|nr:hypothetical protein [Chitinophagaceae bacterium]
MKKAVVSILLLCYLAFTSGVVISQHFCMNKLDATSLFAEKKDDCGRCGMDVADSNGCCKDEVKLVKLDEEQKISPAYTVSSPEPLTLVAELSPFIYASLYHAAELAFTDGYPPPLLKGQDTYLLNSVFRI